jgi:hypothetical protein
MRWSVADPDGIASSELQRSTNGGSSYGAVSLTPSTATTKTLWMATDGAATMFRARATDLLGNTSAWATADPFRLRYVQESAPEVSYAGPWAAAASTTSLGGFTRYATSAGASAFIDLPPGSRAFGLVFSRGSNRGKAQVWVDGSRRATLDLYAGSTRPRWVTYGQIVPATSAHTIEIRVLGTKRSASSGTRIEFDAAVVLGG